MLLSLPLLPCASQLRTTKSPNGLGIAGVPKIANPVSYLGQALSPAGSEPAGSTTDDVALIWLNNQSLTSQARDAARPVRNSPPFVCCSPSIHRSRARRLPKTRSMP